MPDHRRVEIAETVQPKFPQEASKLTARHKDRLFTYDPHSAAASKGASRFISEINSKPKKGPEFTAKVLPQDPLAQDIQQMQQELKTLAPEKKAPKNSHSSIFSLAKSANTHKASVEETSVQNNSPAPPPEKPAKDIFVRFMHLMARIIGQAEAEAHALYKRIKQRTDEIDVLTLLISKINNEKGKVDWSKNDEMKQLVDRVKELGVDIPNGKYAWTEDEKKLLKENIQMRKDSMDKITQMERTDMQKFLQEISQGHQFRSNILKSSKEAKDTVIANMRP